MMDLKKLYADKYMVQKVCIKLIFIIGLLCIVAKNFSIKGMDDYYTVKYGYLTVGNLFQLVIDFFSFLLLIYALCYTIMRVEIIYDFYKTSKEGKSFWYAMYLSVTFILMYNPIEPGKMEVKDFERIIGSGLIQNIDVSRRIGNFHFWILLFAVFFCLFFLLANYITSREWSEEQRKVIVFIEQFIVLANVNLVFTGINFFQNSDGIFTSFSYAIYLNRVILIIAAGYLFLKVDQYMTAEKYAIFFIIAFNVAYPVAIILQQEWEKGKLLLGWQLLLFMCMVIVAKKVSFLSEKRMQYAIRGGGIFSAIIPFITSFYIELINVLNQYGVYVIHLRRYYAMIMFGVFLATIVFGGLAYAKEWSFSNWKSIVFPFIILGISCLSEQVPLEGTYTAHLFERANSSILISDFLNYGSVPLVEHYGGHMMSEVWEGLIYAFINNDYKGAILSPYSGYVISVYAVLFYYLIKNVWNENMALCAALLFPFNQWWEWEYYGMGMFVCLAVVAYVKKNTILRAAIVWFAVIWCIIYRLDLGVAFAFACIMTLLLYILIYKKQSAGWQLILTLAGWGLSGCLVWTTLCIIKGINPVSRLFEFILIGLSNLNWARDSIGDVSNILFSWTYLFVPFSISICLMYTVFSHQIRENSGINVWVILLMLGFSYFGNFSRGLVLHSLVELPGGRYVVWSGYIFLALFISCYWNNRKMFLPIYAGGIIVFVILFWDGMNGYIAGPICDIATSKIGLFTDAWTVDRFEGENIESNGRGVNVIPMTYWEKIAENGQPVNRVRWDDELEKAIYPYQVILDTLLEEDETFVDFINKTFVYSAIGRKNPVYVSQSPLQLSGEFTQEMYIKEIEKVPLVLMPVQDGNEYSNSLIGVPNAYRYYKIAEYIYQKYIPLCEYEGQFAVWCLAERYNEMLEKIRCFGDGIKLINYGYDRPLNDQSGNYSYIDTLHNYSIGQLPRIWAEYDKEKSIENSVVMQLTQKDNMYICDNKLFKAGADGNYLLIHAIYDGQDQGLYYKDNDETTDIIIKAGKYEDGIFQEKCQYHFTLSEGEHYYLIRISTDYYWYQGEINAVYFQSDTTLRDIQMSILEGD